MHRELIHTNQAPAAVGPYSQAVRVGNLLFTAGQIGLDPVTGQMMDADVATQTERVLQNLAAILNAGGSSLEQVIKCTVFLMDMADFAAMNEVYGRFFPQNPPARSTVQVSGLPLGARVEIEAIALVG
jgi:2-iminobutanoate/2-iminopropanoate deaminase